MRRTTLIAATALFSLVSASAGFAQRYQDQDAYQQEAEFVAGLIRLDLPAVADVMAQRMPADPVVAAGRGSALAKFWLPTRVNTAEQFNAAVEALTQYHNRLMNHDWPDGLEDTWARPIWGITYAQDLTYYVLPHLWNATDFAMYGWPNQRQREALERVVPIAYRAASNANAIHQELSQTLPRLPDFVDKFRSTGRWDLLQQAGRFNIPFYRSAANALVLTLDADSAYYKQAGGDPATVRKNRIQEGRLDAQAVLNQQTQAQTLSADVEARMHLLLSHFHAEADEVAQALTAAETAITKGEAARDAALQRGRQRLQADQLLFLARLAKARALNMAARSGSQADVRKFTAYIDELYQAPITGESWLRMVLVTDQRFIHDYQQVLRQSDPMKRSQQLNQAFNHYLRLLDDARLGQNRASVTNFVEQRYAEQVPRGIDLSHLPPAVRFVKIRGNFLEAERTRQAGRPAMEYQALYEDVIRNVDALLQKQGEQMASQLHAQALFFKGASHAHLAQTERAMQTFLQLAGEHPDLSLGEQAARIAYANIGKALYRQYGDENPKAVELYRQAMDTLIQHYPSLEITRLARYDKAAMLREQEQYAQAIEAYASIVEDENHPAYLSANYEQLATMVTLWLDPNAQTGPKLPTMILNRAKHFISQGRLELARGNTDNPDRLKAQLASAMLILAQLRNEYQGQPEEALQLIREVEQDIDASILEPLQANILGQKIRIFQKQGAYEQAEQLLTEYMRTDPDKAGPLGTQVLKSLIKEIDLLRTAGGDAEQQKVRELATVAKRTADTVVLPWVRKQRDFNVEEQLGFEILPARVELAAGDHQQTAERLDSIIERYGKPAQNNMDVVYNRARALRGADRISEAAREFNRIIKFIRDHVDNPDVDVNKGSIYWQSHLAVVQILDRAIEQDKVEPAEIVSYVNRLMRFEDDKTLGGLRERFLFYRNKHTTAR